MEGEYGIFDFKKEPIRVLHYTWIAFFITFFVWFNLPPVISTMIAQFDWLTEDNWKTLIICNVALAIPARIVVGSLIDKYGPRIVFSGLMVFCSIPALIFAFGDTMLELVISRIFLGSIGAGFVIGIKMTANWFPQKQIGRAEGLYAGWGNFGSAAAAGIIPVIAFNILGGENGWRWALAISGILSLVYGIIYYFLVKDHPDGVDPKKAKKAGPMLVSSYGDLIMYLVFSFPLVAAMGLLARNLSTQMVNGDPLISETALYSIYVILGLIYIAHCAKVLQINLPRLKKGVAETEKYPWSSVAALNTTYFANFGAELAVVSMLPMFFLTTFAPLKNAMGETIVTPTIAGIVAGSFAFINLVARPLGGLLSDKMKNRKKTMLIYMVGITLGFFAMGLIGKYGPVSESGGTSLIPTFEGIWWLVVAIIITMACSMFVQGAEGATFAVIPSIKKEMTGQIAGMAGAYGNVGAVIYLIIYASVDAKTFFYILAAGAALSFVVCLIFLKEPKESFVEEDQDEMDRIGTKTIKTPVEEVEI